jgi:hypothetical protein
MAQRRVGEFGSDTQQSTNESARCPCRCHQEYFKDIPTVSLASVTVSVVSVTNKSTQEHFGVPDSVSDVSHLLEYQLPDRLWRRSAQREALTCALYADLNEGELRSSGVDGKQAEADRLSTERNIPIGVAGCAIRISGHCSLFAVEHWEKNGDLTTCLPMAQPHHTM